MFELAKKSVSDACDASPECAIKYFGNIRQINDFYDSSLPICVDTLLEWQQQCLDHLDEQSERSILFCVDEEGGIGKSTFAKWLIRNRNSWACQGGKAADLMHGYRKEADIAIFDMARTNNQEWYPWGFMENLKNGWFTTTKYNGRMHFFKAPKIIVFMNQDPDRTKFTADRYKIFKPKELSITDVLMK